MVTKNDDYPSPALASGLEILKLLQSAGPLTQDALVRSMNIPRTSLLRHLRTLELWGAAERDPHRNWVAKMGLMNLDAPDLAFDQTRRTLMRAAMERSGLTVEWYRGHEGGMALRDQVLAGGDVRVVARPGYLRSWGGEIDAVTRIGYAFDPAAPAPAGEFWRYSRNGFRRTVAENTVRRAVRLAAREGVAADQHFNSNTIRRAAIVLRQNNVYQGVLTLAEPFSFNPVHSPSTLKTLLLELTHAHTLH